MKLKVAMVQYDANEPNIDFNTKVAMKYIKYLSHHFANL